MRHTSTTPGEPRIWRCAHSSAAGDSSRICPFSSGNTSSRTTPPCAASTSCTDRTAHRTIWKIPPAGSATPPTASNHRMQSSPCTTPRPAQASSPPPVTNSERKSTISSPISTPPCSAAPWRNRFPASSTPAQTGWECSVMRMKRMPASSRVTSTRFPCPKATFPNRTRRSNPFPCSTSSVPRSTYSARTATTVIRKSPPRSMP